MNFARLSELIGENVADKSTFSVRFWGHNTEFCMGSYQFYNGSTKEAMYPSITFTWGSKANFESRPTEEPMPLIEGEQKWQKEFLKVNCGG